MKVRIATIFAVGVIVGLLALGVGGTRAGETVKRFAADKGAKTIDVSKYPQAMQDVYNKTFSKRCSKCHTLARPINTDNPPSKWEEYIKKMMRKKDSGIEPAEGKKIWEFLVFDTRQRKTKFWDKLADKEKEAGDRIEKEVKGS